MCKLVYSCTDKGEEKKVKERSDRSVAIMGENYTTFAHRFFINIQNGKTHKGFYSNTHHSHYSPSLL